MNLVNQSHGSTPKYSSPKNMRKKEYNYFTRLVFNVNKNLRNHAQNINFGL